MVRCSSRTDDFVEAEGVTWAPQEIAGGAASRRCRSQKSREWRSESSMVMMVVVRDGRIVESATPTPCSVMLVLVLLGHSQ
jgi:hypothetical protein